MSILKFILIIPVRLYQLVISPLTPMSCRHMPSCSEYTAQAIKEYGLAGIWMGIKRISKCHPWGTHGFDPVPKKQQHVK